MAGTALTGAALTGAALTGATFTGAALTGAALTGSSLDSSSDDSYFETFLTGTCFYYTFLVWTTGVSSLSSSLETGLFF